MGRKSMFLEEHGSDRAIYNLIVENINNSQLSVHYLSDLLQITPQYLYERVRKSFFMCPHELIEDVRLEMALLRLRIGHLPLYNLASEVGYSNYQTFRSAFRKHFHMTPTDFIKSLDGRINREAYVQAFVDELWAGRQGPK